LTPPDRPCSDADPPHAAPARRPGTCEGMTAASGTARTADPTMGTDLNNRIRPPARSRLPFPPAARSSGTRPVTSRTPPAAGLRPVLDPPGRPPRNMAATRETGDPSHARPKAASTAANPPLTRRRSFRDDTERCRWRDRPFPGPRSACAAALLAAQPGLMPGGQPPGGVVCHAEAL
jgi:hypothetical protein